MPDIVVTVPKTFRYAGKVGLAAWLAEGDCPGQPWTGDYSVFTTWGGRPDIQPGERVYVVCEGRLVGYAPLVELNWCGNRVELVRAGGAVACTIPEPITGFRGWRYRWWDTIVEMPLDMSHLYPEPEDRVCETCGADLMDGCECQAIVTGHGAGHSEK